MNKTMLVIIVQWVVRLIFILLLPTGAVSFDALYVWPHCAGLIQKGISPYTSGLMNWPPFWMQCIYLIDHASQWLGISFLHALQLFLISIESIVIVQTKRIIEIVAPNTHADKVVLFGIALNPIAILLVCQHCNFDIIMVLWCVLFLKMFIRSEASFSERDWYAGCAFLGLAIATKTVPIILAPILASAAFYGSLTRKLLGWYLLLMPVALGISIVYCLWPNDVFKYVLSYSSQTDIFGISGILSAIGYSTSVFKYVWVSCVIGFMFFTAWTFYEEPYIPAEKFSLIILFAFLLVFQLTLAPQYFYWIIPFITIAYASTKTLRNSIMLFLSVSALTYVMQYALLPEYGWSEVYRYMHAGSAQDLSLLLQHPTLQQYKFIHFCAVLDRPMWHTISTLPMWLTMLYLMYRIVVQLNKPNENKKH